MGKSGFFVNGNLGYNRRIFSGDDSPPPDAHGQPGGIREGLAHFLSGFPEILEIFEVFRPAGRFLILDKLSQANEIDRNRLFLQGKRLPDLALPGFCEADARDGADQVDAVGGNPELEYRFPPRKLPCGCDPGDAPAPEFVESREELLAVRFVPVEKNIGGFRTGGASRP